MPVLSIEQTSGAGLLGTGNNTDITFSLALIAPPQRLTVESRSNTAVGNWRVRLATGNRILTGRRKTIGGGEYVAGTADKTRHW